MYLNLRVAGLYLIVVRKYFLLANANEYDNNDLFFVLSKYH